MKPTNTGVLHSLEKRFTTAVVPWLPKWATTRRLTLTTVVWCVLCVVFYYLSLGNRVFLLAVSLVIIFQYVTDILDGAVGRYRKTGLVLWGYYMDHLLDYLFLCSVAAGFYFLFPDSVYPFLYLVLFGAFFANAFLKYGILKEFVISMGVFSISELRFVIIGVNLLLYRGLDSVVATYLFPLGMITGSVFFLLDVYKTQKKVFNR